jgi:hypothetical protein
MPSSNRSRSYSRPSSSTYHSSSTTRTTQTSSKPPTQPTQPTQSTQPNQQKGTFSRTSDFISNTLSTAGGFFLGSVLMRSIFGGSSEQNNQSTQLPQQNQQNQEYNNENQYQISSKCRELFKTYSNCMMQKREQGYDLNDTSLCSEELKALNKCQINN